MWLGAENGMFLRSTRGKWMTTMPEHLNVDWIDYLKPVFEYFTERTPLSHFELQKTSLLWNYKYADVEFGRVQAIALLQHLHAGLSNACDDVIQGSCSVEVRAVGVTKGAGIHQILGELAYKTSDPTQIDYVLCIGQLLGKAGIVGWHSGDYEGKDADVLLSSGKAHGVDWLVGSQGASSTSTPALAIPEPYVEQLTAKITRNLESQMEAKVNRKVKERT